MSKRLCVLTGGGHISAFNAAIEALIRTGIDSGWEVVAIEDGWKGMLSSGIKNLAPYYGIDIKSRSGSVIGSSRTNPLKVDGGIDKICRTVCEKSIDVVIGYGGNDTLSILPHLAEQGINVIGIPKTMDNDVGGTHFCFGFPTAVAVGAHAVRNGHNGAYTHEKVYLDTLFGRTTDWVVAGVGYAGCADIIVPAEREYTLEVIIDHVKAAVERNYETFGRGIAIVVVAEGARIKGLASPVSTEVVDPFGNGKLEPEQLRIALKRAFRDHGIEPYGEPIMYLMRDETPILLDQQLAYEAGVCAIRYAEAGRFEVLTAVHCDRETFTIQPVPLSEALAKTPRLMSKEGAFFNYDTLTITSQGATYFASLLGPSPDKRGLLPPILLKDLPAI